MASLAQQMASRESREPFSIKIEKPSAFPFLLVEGGEDGSWKIKVEGEEGAVHTLAFLSDVAGAKHKVSEDICKGKL
jgi:hypothetical protein